MSQKNKFVRRKRIKRKIRSNISGTNQRPRLSVYRSLNHIYAQIIDDENGVTMASVSSLIGKDKKIADGNKKDTSKEVGKKLAEVAKAKGVETVVFDRNGYRYHGRVKALADGAREGGLKF
jgi:large subunit ribosomal protein L18